MATRAWLDHTFNSRPKTEQLLRPDLESGQLSQHDYDLAVNFLPGIHRYWPYIHAIACGAATGFAFYRFRPAYRHARGITIAATASGYAAGILHYFHDHKVFVRQLHDRKAFLLALENVNQRLGNRTQLFPNLERSTTDVPTEGLQDDRNSSFALDGFAANGTQSADSPRRPNGAVSGTPRQPQTTWDAIRAANARNSGHRSSWDELRQKHERARVQPNDSGATSENEGDARARAQAEFDALLEAERRMSRS